MEYIVFMVCSPIAVTVLFITLGAIWKYRNEKLGLSLLVYFILALLFLIFNILEVIAESGRWMLIWTKLEISIYVLIPVSWVVFAGFLVNPKGRLGWIKYYILLVPVLTIFLVCTYPLHELFYVSHIINHHSGFSTLDMNYGFFFWVFGAHSYVLLLVGTCFIVRYLRINTYLAKGQASLILIASLLPTLFNAMYFLPLPVFVHKDYTALALAVSGVLFFIGIFWGRFFDIIPYARNQIVDGMDQGVIIIDRMDRILDINSAALNLFDIGESVRGSNIGAVTPLWDALSSHYKFKKCTFETSVGEGEMTRTCVVNIKPIHIRQSGVDGVLIIINDISLLVGLYEEKIDLLKRMEDTFERLNSTQIQLIHKEKLASIGQISAGVAHEIKNPLSFLKSNHRYLYKLITKLEDRCSSGEFNDEFVEAKDVLSDSNEGMNRILDVVNNLLAFSRKDEKIKRNSSFDINEGLENTLKILRGTIDPDIKIDRNYGNVASIECNENEIKQVFLNLLTNAAQASEVSDRDNKRISIKTRDDDKCVYFEIGNTGMPIDPELREKIFEPFFTTKTAEKGTGLGLSIASDIVLKRHNGTINIDDNNGMTTFIVKLPRRMEA